ncbi:hypothetical protein [Streptomyces canus]|uniref:hypothetical protein n=1 Tax=Streptomyces canus TaxID=58343 RepID=UPI0022593F92|nr:hypothetical protein [Streptomyces canus]MCX4852348.1 hypothetical protein [Streptomyces canus]
MPAAARPSGEAVVFVAGTDLDAGARGVERRDGQDPLRTSRDLEGVRDLDAAGDVRHRVDPARVNGPHSFDQ